MTKVKVMQLGTEISLLRHEAGKKELWRTMHALDTASRIFGYELAISMEKGKEKPSRKMIDFYERVLASNGDLGTIKPKRRKNG